MSYDKLVAALRGLASGRWRNCEYTWFADEQVVFSDAADAIEALQAQLPKRGEWIVKGANRIDCSVCGHSICFASVLGKGSLTGYNYCPRCGAKMEVRDG